VRQSARRGWRFRYSGAGVKTKGEWAGEVRGLLRAEMTERGITYKDLFEKLAAIGVNENSATIRSRISRGKLTAMFLIQCLTAMGCRSLWIGKRTIGD
jgi:Domain of unknown function (DUF6471)